MAVMMGTCGVGMWVETGVASTVGLMDILLVLRKVAWMVDGWVADLVALKVFELDF